MYEDYIKDIKTIKSYEGKIKEFGVQWGQDNIEAFKEYNASKYRISIDGLGTKS